MSRTSNPEAKLTAEYGDGHYGVEDGKCGDGREYDLRFDKSFKLIERDADD